MKKFLITSLALAFVLVSCTKEIVGAGENTEVEVSFETGLDGVGSTRAYSDGKTANKLTYYVYSESEDGTSTLLDNLAKTVEMTGGTAKVSLKLITGRSYSIVFWADAKGLGTDGNPYTYSADGKTITVSYENAVAQDESRDAFWHYTGIFKVNGPASSNIQLRRPFAQINVGTDDMSGDGVDGFIPEKASMSVSGVSNTLDLVDGTVGNENVVATFSEADIPAYNSENPELGEQFPVAGHRYVAMSYVLVGPEKSTVNVKVNCGAPSGELSFSSVPVQGNYRTNIYGSLFTSPSDWNVNNDPGYGSPDQNTTEPWDGVSAEEVIPVVKTIDGAEISVYEIKGPNQLAWISEQTNLGNLLDAYVELSADIDLDNKDWTPLANVSRKADAATTFTGTFDGNGHTVYNLKSSAAGDNMGCGLISVANGASIMNVTVKGGELSSVDFAGAVVGFIGGTTTVEGCRNVGVKVSGAQAAGGVVGRVYGTDCIVRNCENSGEVSGAKKNGGVVGIASVGGYVIENCKNSGRVLGSNDGCGGVVGYAGTAGKIISCENTGAISTDNENSKFVGGIVGYGQANGVEIISCINRGEIKGQSAGGIFGAPGSTQVIDIISCENYGTVTGAEAGGIAGNAASGELSSCRNYGTVTATEIAGGVAGTKIKGLMKGNLGGSATVNAPIKGRVLGAARSGAGDYLSIAFEAADNATNAHSSALGSVGAVGTYTTLASIKVIGGTLMGTPRNASASSANIYVEGASWDAFPGEIGKWTAAANSSNWIKQAGSGEVKVTVNGASYSNLADAIAAQTKDSMLEIVDETVWPAATPAYYGGNFYSTISDVLKASYMAGEGDKVITLRPDSDLGVITHAHVADNLTIYGNGATVGDGGEHDFEIDTYKYNRETGRQDAVNGEYLTKDITLNIYNLNGCAAWGQRNTEHKITLNFYNCKNMNRIYFTGDKGEIEMNLEDCSFVAGVNRGATCAIKTDSKGIWTISNCYFERISEVVAMTNENGFGKFTLTNCEFKNCGTKALAESLGSTAWCSTVRSLGRQPAEMVLDGCIFSNDSSAELNSADIVVGELRPENGKATSPVKYSIRNTVGTLKVIKPHGVVDAIEATDYTLTAADVKEGTNE